MLVSLRKKPKNVRDVISSKPFLGMCEKEHPSVRRNGNTTKEEETIIGKRGEFNVTSVFVCLCTSYREKETTKRGFICLAFYKIAFIAFASLIEGTTYERYGK